MADQELIDGKVEVRPRSDGSFDELVMYDGEASPTRKCLAHAEMMDDKNLWIGFYPPNSGDSSVFLNIGIKNGKLHIMAEES